MLKYTCLLQVYVIDHALKSEHILHLVLLQWHILQNLVSCCWDLLLCLMNKFLVAQETTIHLGWYRTPKLLLLTYIFIDLFCHFRNQILLSTVSMMAIFLPYEVYQFIFRLVKIGKSTCLTLVLSRICEHYYVLTFAATFSTVSACGYLKGRTN